MASDTPVLSHSAEVEAALLSSLLVPPPAPESLTPGPTADLRSAMARFSDGQSHGARRTALDRAVAAISNHPFAGEAQRRTAEVLTRIRTDRTIEAAADIGFVVPVVTLAAAMGVPDAECDDVRRDIKEVAKVIGRGEPSRPKSDEATLRLVKRFGDGSDGHVARVSLLYQTHDAAVALFASMLLSNQTGNARRAAGATTARTATASVTIGSTTLEAGTTVVIDIESAPYEFGLGPHGCPGRSIAERIVAGMVGAVCSAGLELDVEAAERKADGRLTTLPLRRAQ